MNPQISSLTTRLDYLGLAVMSNSLESFLSDPARKDETLLDSLNAFLDIEYCLRKEGSARTRIKESGMPGMKRLEDYDLTWIKGGLSPAKFKELSSLAFIERKKNVVLLGPSGLGKTHLMLALGHHACMNGYTAYYLSCRDAIDALKRADNAGRLKRKLKWLTKPHVLLLDEVGYESLSPEQASMLFQLINARYEHGLIIITSNKSFGKWAELMSDEAVATAMLDRLLHHAHVLSLKGDSYRMKDRLKAGAVNFD
ncbi:MAG TPA: IS21-like element helper ATPase IstB [Spirochaetota bacterium]|nr:IS21-like element helper ATPase IstB [Spirochaetota bacterium]HQF10267.1 IS21-like element helper ATPase IstB [Spirochaetota bacterium]HQH99145.1 IS21-like element helper ATPase IstB [Spirochaetota bacterium]HQJ72574.1 IS21-like element helper ATPase IstB [Spirochaetota bacterium]HRS78995.1 IS21-like element helper ATPase IstB [Spirochaetota bacterium]